MTKLTTGLSLREQSSLTLRIAKFPFLQINCDVANAKILDSYFNVSRGIMILREKIS